MLSEIRIEYQQVFQEASIKYCLQIYGHLFTRFDIIRWCSTQKQPAREKVSSQCTTNGMLSNTQHDDLICVARH